MDNKPTCEVECDVPRNLITVRYHGHVAAAEMKAYAEKVMGLLPLLRRGFAFLTDLSSLESMELECAPELSRIMDACRAQGIGTVVRIIPDPSKDIGLNILSIIHLRRGVRVVTCQTAEEAARALA
jgi:hypothetical protein